MQNFNLRKHHMRRRHFEVREMHSELLPVRLGGVLPTS